MAPKCVQGVSGCVLLGGGGSKPYETLLTYFSCNLHLCEMSEAHLNGGRTAAWIGCGWHC